MSTQRRRVLENDKKLEITADGVYIEGLDRKAYTVDDWQGGNAANSIIVASGDVKFRMALTQTRTVISSSYSDPLDNYMTSLDSTAAKADYDGAGNTAKIIQAQPSTSFAAGYCNAFVFPDGKTRGYLPAFGQLYLAYWNKAAVTTALNKCGGTAMNEAYYWSSTYCGRSGDQRRCWWLSWSNGYVDFLSLDYNLLVRPFADIS